jgi:hypothetical protein
MIIISANFIKAHKWFAVQECDATMYHHCPEAGYKKIAL